MTQEAKIQHYIQAVNDAYVQTVVTREPTFYKYRMLTNFGLSEENFYLTCDELKCEEDVVIIKTILEMSERIVLLIREKKSFCSLWRIYGQRIIFYDVSKLEYAFSSDIHIFFHDTVLQDILCKHAKAFNTVHPLSYPVKNIQSLSEWGDDEKLNFFFGDEAQNIATFEDLVFAYFKDYMSPEEIRTIIATLGIQRFYLFFQHALSCRAFLGRIFEIMFLSYRYGVQKSVKKNILDVNILTFFGESSSLPCRNI